MRCVMPVPTYKDIKHLGRGPTVLLLPLRSTSPSHRIPAATPDTPTRCRVSYALSLHLGPRLRLMLGLAFWLHWMAHLASSGRQRTVIDPPSSLILPNLVFTQSRLYAQQSLEIVPALSLPPCAFFTPLSRQIACSAPSPHPAALRRSQLPLSFRIAPYPALDTYLTNTNANMARIGARNYGWKPV